MTASEILARVNGLAADQPVLISLSGGNPALQPLDDVCMLGRLSGHCLAMETQVSVPQSLFAQLDWLISPKPPSSGMTTDWNALGACVEAAGSGPCCVLKIVVFDETDYACARTAASHCPKLKTYLQVGNPAPLYAAGKVMPEAADIGDLMNRFRWLAGRTIADRWFEVTVLP